MKIYLASSWRNKEFEVLTELLEENHFEFFSFREPVPGNHGFAWSHISDRLDTDSVGSLGILDQALSHEKAKRHFNYDFTALRLCDICLLILPAGNSAHLEAGFACGMNKPLIIYHNAKESHNDYKLVTPELMYKMADIMVDSRSQLVYELNNMRDLHRMISF